MQTTVEVFIRLLALVGLFTILSGITLVIAMLNMQRRGIRSEGIEWDEDFSEN